MAKRKPKDNQSKALPDSKATVSAVVDETHSRLVEWVNEADDASNESRDLSEKCRAYYDSVQWTDAERVKLAAQKQAATVINRCKPKVDALLGMERANRTTAKAQPRTPKHAQGATAATEAVRFVLQDNMYSRHRSDAWENLLIEGTGGLEIIVKPKDEGYKVIVRHIMWDRLLWDPHSRRKDFSDARYLGQVVWMDYDEAVVLYPEAQDVLESMQNGSKTFDDKPRWMDNSRKRVKIVEMYYREDDGDWYYACFTYGGYCKAPMKSPYVNEEGETEHGYEFASLFVDREGCRYGSLRQVLDVQDEINKRRSKALHLMSVRQTFGTKGAVEDLNKARQELAKPDGHVEFAYGELNKDFGVLPTGDMAQAQFNLLTEAKMEMDLVGANAATQGKDKTVQSGVALRQRALTGQTELAPMFDMLKNLDIRVYRKVWNRIKQYWKEETWLRVTDDENNLKFVGLNKPLTKGEQALQQAAAQGVPPEMLQQLQAQIQADPMMQEIVGTENDIVNLDVDIIMDDAPDSVTQEVEDFQAMAEMVKSGFPLPPEAVIMASPLSNKDKIIKMMKEQPQMSPEHQKQMEESQQQMQKLAEENQKLKTDQSSQMAKIQADHNAKMKQLELDLLVEKEKAKLARAKAEAEINLAKLKAGAEVELQENKNKSDVELGKKKLEQDKFVKMQENGLAADADVMPILVERIDKSFEGIASALEKLAEIGTQQLQLTQQLISLQEMPRSISIGQIQRDANGLPSGAMVTPKFTRTLN